jgi:maltooligosyltrehalose trehalohydrolase
MRRSHNGFWIATCATGPGTRYRFDVDGLNVPDPASHFQPRDVHGPSQVIDHRSFVWQHADWVSRPWEETVFYEVHPGIMGGFEGVRARLPALAELGITAIELMPIADFAGSRNWGYDGVLPFAPDSAYGTPDDLRTLIDTAHGLGPMVISCILMHPASSMWIRPRRGARPSNSVTLALPASSPRTRIIGLRNSGLTAFASTRCTL